MRRFQVMLLGCVALAGITAVASCARHSAPAGSGNKVLLIGLDGAEWDLIRPMAEAGELPNLARLMKAGVYGNLRSLEPLAKSPAIWTTIATGKSPEEHGIDSFVDKVGGRPLTQNMRKVRALWNIFSAVGRKVGVVGWLMSWPAEEVNGFVISDYLQYEAHGSTRMNARTYPPGLEQEITPFVVDWERLPWSFVEPFLDTPADTLHLDENLQRLIQPIKWIGAGDVTFARVGEKLYRKEHPDFFAVYLRGMDAMGHLYWNYMQPEAVTPGTLDPEGMKYLKGAERAYYRFTDKLIGPILDAADAHTTILVVSDHGFAGGMGRGVEAHKLDGVFIMAGNHVGRGEISGASVYDIAPTVLAILGLPPATDMRGSVLWSALDSSIPHDRFQHRIATYETGAPRTTQQPLESPIDAELKDRLKSLGYLND
jgi:predicted AlkP superfamily phosphohydrolase/phosphomutase